MIVYIWKDKFNVPFYVGLTKNISRSNPRNKSEKRNWLTRNRIDEIGIDNIVIEIIHINSVEAGKELECKLINQYGRVQMGSGTLTNLKEGGGVGHILSEEERKKRSDSLKDPSHPIWSEKAREKQRKRMKDPDVLALFSGDKNPAKRLDVREKLKAKWADPEYRAKRISEKVGKPIHSEEHKEKLRQRMIQMNKDKKLKINSEVLS